MARINPLKTLREKNLAEAGVFEELLQAKIFLRSSGSSVKMLLENLALRLNE